MVERERMVVRKSELLTVDPSKEGIWTALLETVHNFLKDDWKILHVDESTDDLVVSLYRQL